MAAWRTASALVLALLGLAIAQDSVRLSARCPEFCQPDLQVAFAACARFRSVGCTLEPCSEAGTFRCVPDMSSTTGDPDLVITPGGNIVIDSVKVNDFFKFQVDLEAAAPLETDLYLLSDATGSMSEAVDNVKEKFKDLVEFFDDTGSDMRYGVGFFRDESELVDGFENAQPLTSDRNAVQDAINELEAIQGGDENEANLAALLKVATEPGIGWREKSRKIVAYFGDNPGHEPTCVDGNSIDRDIVIEELNKKNITVIGVSFGADGLDKVPESFGCGSGSAGPAQGTEIAFNTGGVLVSSFNQGGLIDGIIGATNKIPKTFNVTSDCEGLLRSSTRPMLPVTLDPGESKMIEQLLVVEAGVCDGPDSFECEIRYTEENACLPPSTVEVLEVTGCE